MTMDPIDPFPFAQVGDLRDRWPDMPPGSDAHAEVLLEDASQFILDVAPSAARVHARTRKRVVCAVVKRAMLSDDVMPGASSVQDTAGPYSQTVSFSNPTGDFYLTKQEKKALGVGRQRAFNVDVLAGHHVS